MNLPIGDPLVMKKILEKVEGEKMNKSFVS